MKEDIVSEPTNFMDEVRERFRKTVESWDSQYKLSIDETNFLNVANQWPSDTRAAREGKPTIASDRLNAQVKQIVNEQKSNRPAIRFNAVNNTADEDTANVLQGIARHIEYQSKADLAYDTAFEHAVQGGIGFIRLLTDYEDKSFNQRILIEEVPNPFMVYVDPAFRKVDGSDINYAFILDLIPDDEFKRLYPDAELSGQSRQAWMNIASRYPEWFDQDRTAAMVCEYFVKEYETYTLVKLKDGTIMDRDDCTKRQLRQVTQSREDTRASVKWYKLCCMEVLEESEWIGKDIPVIPVFGDCLLDNGTRVFSGLIRNNKETQIMLNTVKTVTLEMIARAPKNPWLVAEGSVDNHRDEWASVNILDLPYLTYAIVADDHQTPLPPPIRQTAEPPIQGMLQVMSTLENDIKSANAMYDPTMGEKMANDQSGVAIKALQQAGSVAHYNYSDNLSRAIRVIGHQLLDLIPKIYSEERVIRIIGIDDKHKLITINGQPQPGTEQNHEMDENGVAKVYDVTTGEYDVTVDTGPSYTTRRQENLNVLTELAMKNQMVMQFCTADIIRLMDFPESATIADMLDKMKPPQLQTDKNGQPSPTQLQQQLDQAHQMIQQLTQTLQTETQLADKEATKLKIATLENQTELIKQQKGLDHDAALTTMKAELEEIRATSDHSKSLIAQVHQHVLDKNAAEHEALLGQLTAPQPVQAGAGVGTPTPTQNPTQSF
jgi:hypothetical protein